MSRDGNKGFNIDGPFMHVLEIIFNLWMLNMITIICCIPIVTAGAALTAMNHQLYLIAKKEDGYVIRGFFKDFKANFKRSTPAGIIMMLSGIVLLYDAYIFINGVGETTYSTLYRWGVVAVMLVWLFVFVYLFPILARYDSPLGLAFKNALFMSVYKIFKTILMVVLILIPVVLTMIVENFWIWDILFGLSLPSFANVYLYKGTFEAFEKSQNDRIKKENGEEDAENTSENSDEDKNQDLD